MKKVTFSARRIAALAMALFCFSTWSIAQQLFAPLPSGSKQQLSAKAVELLGQYRQMDRFTAVTPLGFGELSRLGNNRHLEVVLQEGKAPIGFDLQTIEYESEESWFLYGSLDKAGLRNHPKGGEIMIRSREGEKFGTVQLGEAFFRVDALDASNSVLLKNGPLSPEELLETDCAHMESPVQDAFVEQIEGESSARFGLGCRVRVLMLYSPALLAVVPNMTNHAQTHIDQINQGIAVSDVGSTELRFELAGVRLISGFTERDKNAYQVIGELSGNASALQYRQQDNADLVCLVVNNAITDFFPVAGIANYNSQPGSCFSVIREFNSLPLKLFPHEIGHNMGCHHENVSASNYNRAYVFDRLVSLPGQPAEYQTYRTLMNHVARTSNLLRYSNPIVPFLGGPTGTSTNDNARKLKERACFVAGFMPTPPSMSVSISGDQQACPGIGEACFPSFVTGGSQSIISYQWAYSLNGTSYTNFSTVQHPCLSMSSFQNGQTVSIRLTATSGPLTATAFHTLEVTNNAPGGCLFWGKLAVESSLGLEVFPNPSPGKGSIALALPQEDEVELSLFDLAGKQLKVVLNKALSAGTHEVPFDASQLAQGTYVLVLKTSESRLQKRVVIAD